MKDMFKRIKKLIDNKIKKGFTLVELLAVIVILAIIMLIAIPAVLDTLEISRKKAFIEYADKVTYLAEQKSLSTELLQDSSYSECTIYDITKDLDLSSTGDYKGYILIKKTATGKEYLITMWDGNFMLRPYNYTNKLNHTNVSSELVDALEKYNESLKEELSISNLCGYGCKECTTQSSETIAGRDTTLYNVLKLAKEEGKYAKEYSGLHQDSMNKSLSTQKIYYWYGSSANANEILEKNNVLFAGFCWQMIRTTDTGGVKMIYNGPSEDGKCLATRTTRLIGSAKFNTNYTSLADVGYMYNTRYPSTLKKRANIVETKYSKSFTWDGSKYILNNSNSITFSDLDTNSNKTKLNNAHYTCWNTSGECTSISYIYYLNSAGLYYINLTDGKNIEDAKKEMLYNDDVNKNDSTMKTYIETWYENNLASYGDKLEDTIFCNDRRQSNTNANGWNPNGGSITTNLEFKSYNEPKDLSCVNETDKFSTLNNKAKLKYKIGLMSVPELSLLNENALRSVNTWYRTGSPAYFSSSGFIMSVYTKGGFADSYGVSTTDGVRPAVSLAPGTEYTNGDGSTANPYIIS